MSKIPLYVIADCSGSMAESGKSEVLAYLLSYVAECVRMQHLPEWCAEVRALAWSATVQPLPLPVDRMVLPLRPSGRADMAVLMGALEREAAGAASPLRVLLMSDGGIDHASQKRWQAFCNQYPINVRALAIGPDASRSTMEAVAGKGQMYEAEDIVAALHDWGDAHRAPRTLADTRGDDWR